MASFHYIFLSLLYVLVASHGINSGLTVETPLRPAGRHDVPFAIRAHWMHQTTQALREQSSPCPFAAFGTAIVNHTGGNGLGDLICTGVNDISSTGNPTHHGEISAIDNCTQILQDPHGRFRLSPSETQAAFTDLTLYTNAESCPMCAAAIRWAGFREYVYSTSIDKLIEFGWGQINISSLEIFEHSRDLSSPYPRVIKDLLPAVTDPLFRWQFDDSMPCPLGCERVGDGSTCKIAVSF
ncbi:nucleoside deaminase [Aspergillus mulundensis]|uniref:CMP/dCMP-type deaminase domain-containing protein n=1 Tax=Aspergillus mulundensis TaxID=1810919 RepID=A0A3D8SUU9_9EURO|nr:Uncharacterized protein DSM5745_01819 [Aspergillus mulundensis]RDW90044.1 Uncharacterized protein DSM5745_01819 [Aspergillus mulundensis]